jgi:hypothetical protein
MGKGRRGKNDENGVHLPQKKSSYLARDSELEKPEGRKKLCIL